MTEKYSYATHRDIKFEHLQLIDIEDLVSLCDDAWFNQALTVVNDSVVRLGVVIGEYHWHQHEDDDEFFLVLAGKLSVDLEDRTFELGPNQGVTIPRGTLHRTRALTQTVVLMVEPSTTEPTGD